MIQIRSSVFETNSSSSHSLVVKKHSEYYNSEELMIGMWFEDDNAIDIWDDDDLNFGRAPFRCLETFYEKVKYAIASMCRYSGYEQEQFEKIERLVTEILPECKKIKLPKARWNDDKPYYGYVDENILTPFLEQNNISLREFLTNKKYVVIVDGDEYCIWDSLKNSGLVNQNEIEKEFPDYDSNSL